MSKAVQDHQVTVEDILHRLCEVHEAMPDVLGVTVSEMKVLLGARREKGVNVLKINDTIFDSRSFRTVVEYCGFIFECEHSYPDMCP